MMTTRRRPRQVSGFPFVQNHCRRAIARVLKEFWRTREMMQGRRLDPPPRELWPTHEGVRPWFVGEEVLPESYRAIRCRRRGGHKRPGLLMRSTGRCCAKPTRRQLAMRAGAFKMIPNNPFSLKRLKSGRSGSASQIIASWPETASVKVRNPQLASMSSTTIAPPGRKAAKARSTSKRTFCSLCRLSWIKTSISPSLDNMPGRCCLLVPFM